MQPDRNAAALAKQNHRILLIGGSGYIGSYLAPRLRSDGYSVDICDLGWRGHPGASPDLYCNYASLTRDQLRGYSTVLWFAGHSSVAMAVADPLEALRNNCTDLTALCERLTPGTRLIYASTASLYSTFGGSQPPLASEDDVILADGNAYDISKFCFDYIARTFFKDVVGLRLGTVCGWSPNLRRELVFNAMNLSAMEEGVVRVANASSCRSLLFLDDLLKSVRACIHLDGPPPKIFNLASATLTIGELAERIAGYYGVPILKLADSTSYSFRLDTRRARESLGLVEDGDVMTRCEEFQKARSENDRHRAVQA
jgi:nucleoside-diphosphate-sugar epimerase